MYNLQRLWLSSSIEYIRKIELLLDGSNILTFEYYKFFFKIHVLIFYFGIELVVKSNVKIVSWILCLN